MKLPRRLIHLALASFTFLSLNATAGPVQSLVKVTSASEEAEILIEVDAAGNPVAMKFNENRYPMTLLQTKGGKTALGDGKYGVDIPVPGHSKILAIHSSKPLANGDYTITLHYGSDYRKAYTMKLTRSPTSRNWTLKNSEAGLLSCLYMGRKRASMIIRACDSPAIAHAGDRSAPKQNQNVADPLSDAMVYEAPRKKLPENHPATTPAIDSNPLNGPLDQLKRAGQI